MKLAVLLLAIASCTVTIAADGVAGRQGVAGEFERKRHKRDAQDPWASAGNGGKSGKSHKDDWGGGGGDIHLGRFGDVAYASGAQETPDSNGPVETTTTAKVMFDFDPAFTVMDYKIDIVSKVSSYE